VRCPAPACQCGGEQFCWKILSSPGKVVTDADSCQNWRSEILNWRRNGHCVTLVQNVLNCSIADPTAAKLVSGKDIHNKIWPKHERVYIVVELRGRISAFHADHDPLRVPITRFPCQLVLGNLGYPLAHQGLSGVLNVSVGELISGG